MVIYCHSLNRPHGNPKHDNIKHIWYMRYCHTKFLHGYMVNIYCQSLNRPHVNPKYDICTYITYIPYDILSYNIVI